MRKLDERILQLASAQLGNARRKQAYGLGATRAACDRRVASGAWLLIERTLVDLAGVVGDEAFEGAGGLRRRC